jgi:tetratricopeptide (TPR) repeat protein
MRATPVALTAVLAAALCAAQAAPQTPASGVLTAVTDDPAAATRLFERANALYAAGSYDEAAPLYEQVLAGGFRNADVCHNLGNAYYKSGRVGRAVLSYLRALELDPGHADAATNLAFVRERLADRQTTAAQSAFGEAVDRAYRRLPSTTLAVVASVLYFALAAALVTAILRGGFGPWTSRAAWVLGVALVVVAGTALLKVQAARAAREAVVLEREVAVRTGPGDEFVIEFKLHEGTTVRLRETRGEWARVSVAGTDLEGWLPGASVEAVKQGE